MQELDHDGTFMLEPEAFDLAIQAACRSIEYQHLRHRIIEPPCRFILGDSKLVVQCANGDWAVQGDMLSYLATLAGDLYYHLVSQGVLFRSYYSPGQAKLAEHIPREHNMAADALSKDGTRGLSREIWNVPLLQQYQHSPSSYVMLLTFDGGAQPNPGPSGCGCCVWLAQVPAVTCELALDSLQWESLCSRSAYLGKQTNNVAEWHGLLSALLAVSKCRIRRRD